MNELFGLQNNSLAFTDPRKSILHNPQDLVQSFPQNITHLNPEINPNLLVPQKLPSQTNLEVENLSQNNPLTSIAGEPHENGSLTDLLTGNDVLEHNIVRRDAAYNWDIYESVEETGNNEIDALTGYSKWNLDDLNHKITYSFLKAGDDYYGEQPGLAELNDTAKNLVRQVMNDLENIIPIDFVEVPYSYDNPGIISLMGIDTNWSGYAYYPGGDLIAGDIYLSNSCDFDSQWAYKIISHEVGHALGLKHPGDYSQMGGGAESPFLPTSQDNTDWTVMSYNYTDVPTTHYQSLDVQALQSLYPKTEKNTVPTITINNVSLKEGNSRKIAKFSVRLDEPSDQIVKVNFKTVDKSAQAGDDYRYKSGTLTFLPGETTKKIKIAVSGDRLNETKEFFGISLTHPKNAEITDDWGRVTIRDND